MKLSKAYTVHRVSLFEHNRVEQALMGLSRNITVTCIHKQTIRCIFSDMWYCHVLRISDHFNKSSRNTF